MIPPLIDHVFAQNFQSTTLIPSDDLGAECDFAAGKFEWSCFPAYLNYLGYVVIGFTVAIALVMIIMSGYRYAVSPLLGEGTNEGAKRAILYALLGTGVALLAYVIINAIFVTLTT
jgi:hypothetical protein